MQFSSSSVKKIIGISLSLGVIGLAIFVLHHTLRTITFADVQTAIMNTPAHYIGYALLSTLVSYVALAAYDIFAARTVVPGRISPGFAGFAGAAGSAICNTLGFHLFLGGVVRYRIYERAGLGIHDIGRITGLALGGLWLGYIGILCVALCFSDYTYGPAAGFGILLCFAAAFYYLHLAPRTVSFRRFSFPFPSGRSAAGQMLIGIIEMAAAMSALHVLLPEGAAPDFAPFALMYIGGILLGAISHAPGGVGVFEATILAATDTEDRAAVIAALLLYRCIYNLLPFVLACVAMVFFEFIGKKKRPAISAPGDESPQGD